MNGGTAIMMLTTVIASAFSTSPVNELNMLNVSSCNAQVKELNSQEDVIKAIENRQVQLDELLFEIRDYYSLLSQDYSLFVEGQADDLRMLDLSLRGQSEYLKKFWRDYNETIVIHHGELVHKNFRKMVGSFAQLRKNVSNIVKLNSTIKGEVKLVAKTAFKPNSHFFKAAVLATAEAYNIH